MLSIYRPPFRLTFGASICIENSDSEQYLLENPRQLLRPTYHKSERLTQESSRNLFLSNRYSYQIKLTETPYKDYISLSGSFLYKYFVIKFSYVNTEGSYANTEGSYMNTEDSYMNTEGSYTNTEGSYANTEDSYANTKDSYANTEGSYVNTRDSYANTEDE